MTDYQYTVQYKSGHGSVWELSQCVQEEWKNSIRELLNDIDVDMLASSGGSYRFVRRPVKDEQEVME